MLQANVTGQLSWLLLPNAVVLGNGLGERQSGRDMVANPNPFQILLTTPEPAALGPERRAGTLPVAALEARLEGLLAAMPVPAARQPLVRALTLLWHDHLDAAHALVQSRPEPEAGFIHAMMHRREPDYWNSKYWWRRVGAHAVFAELAHRAQPRLTAHLRAVTNNAAAALIRNARWQPETFVDLCAAATTGAPTAELRALQQMEFETLLEFLIRP